MDDPILHISEGVLQYCISMGEPEELTIPEGVESIGPGACARLRSVKRVTIPSSVRHIGPRAFAECSALESVEVPETVGFVGDEAFSGCVSLSSIAWSPKTLFGLDCLSGCRSLRWESVDGMKRRLFYLAAEDQIAVTEEHCRFPSGTVVYKGYFAPHNYPLFGKIDKSIDHFFAVMHDKDGVEHVWYGTDVETALIGAQFACTEKTIRAHFGKTLFPDTVVTPKDFGIIAGICDVGISRWLKAIGKDWDWQAPLGEVMSMVKQTAPGAYKRAEYALNHQNEDVHLHDLSNGITERQAFGLAQR